VETAGGVGPAQVADLRARLGRKLAACFSGAPSLKLILVLKPTGDLARISATPAGAAADRLTSCVGAIPKLTPFSGARIGTMTITRR